MSEYWRLKSLRFCSMLYQELSPLQTPSGKKILKRAVSPLHFNILEYDFSVFTLKDMTKDTKLFG